MNLKKVVLEVLTRPAILRRFAPFTRDVGVILMMHRFADAEMGTLGHDATALRDNLEFLRANDFTLLRVDELVCRIERRQSITRCVAFTVDDGYADFGTVGAQAFASYDCPVTVFLATGFIDGDSWYWWDKIELAIMSTSRQACRFSIDGEDIVLDLASHAARTRAVATMVEWVKRVDDARKEAAIVKLAEVTGVEIPRVPPARYGPLTWDMCRRLESAGASFGPHTVSHPVLSKVSDARASEEISKSWDRVRSELNDPVPVFCYPVGTADDITEREPYLAQHHGLRMALSAIPGFITSGGTRQQRFALPRFAYPEESNQFRQIVGGLERAKSLLRERIAQARSQDMRNASKRTEGDGAVPPK